MPNTRALLSGVRSLVLVLTSGSVGQRILGVTAMIGMLSVASKAFAALKDTVVAARFGIGVELDAMASALILPTILVNIIGGAFGMALVPAFVNIADRFGRKYASQLLTALVVLALIMLSALALLGAAARTPIVSNVAIGFDADTMELATSLYVIMLPICIFGSMNSILGSSLNSIGKFVFAATSPVVIPVVSIIAVAGYSSIHGIYALAYGMVAGYALEFLILLVIVMRHGLLTWPFWQVDVLKEFRMAVPQVLLATASSGLMSLTVAVDQYYASQLGSGAVSGLSYGNKIVTLVLGLGATALGSAALPYLARMVSSVDYAGLHRLIRKVVLLTVLVSAPFSVALLVFSQPIIELAFMRGSFTQEDATAVAQIMAVYALQIPAYMIWIFMARVATALRDAHIVVIAALVNLILNAVLDKYLSAVFGAIGIAAATSITYSVLAVGLWWLYQTRVPRLQEQLRTHG